MSFFISDALAEGGAQAQGPGFELIIMIALFFGIMYFMIIRPQTKRDKEHKKMVAQLAKGDEVVTTGGLAGKIVEVGESYVQLEIAEGTVVKVQKLAVSTPLPKGTLKNL